MISCCFTTQCSRADKSHSVISFCSLLFPHLAHCSGTFCLNSRFQALAPGMLFIEIIQYALKTEKVTQKKKKIATANKRHVGESCLDPELHSSTKYCTQECKDS